MTAAAEGHGRVTEAVDAVRLHLRRRAALAGVLWGAAGFGAVLVLAWWLAGPDGWRQGSAVPLLLDLSLLLLASCLALVLGRGRRRWPAESPVVREMEYSAGLGTGEVEGVLQLARAVPAGVSASLAALAERGVVGRLDLPESRLSGALGVQARLWVRRGGAILAMVAPMTVLLLVSSPARSMGAWSGLGRPLSLIARPELPPIQVAPGDVEVSRGSPLTVTVSAPGRAEVTLRWQGAGDVARTETKATEGLEVGFRFPSVRVEIEYSVTTPDGAQSPRFLISPVDPLLVSDVTVALTFPPHTGRAPEEYRGETPPLVIPVGTRLGLEGQATRPLSEARLEREEDGLGVPLEVAGLGFSGDWLPRDGGRYQWRFLDSDGKAAEIVPPPLEVTVVPDSAPAVRFAFPAADTVLPLNLRQPLVIEVRDDHGVGALELVAYRITALGERRPPVVQRTRLGGNRAVLARPLLDLSSWGLLPGDTVRYFARALDNAPTPASAATREYVLRMPGAAELRREAQQELEAMTGRLQELLDRAERAAEQTLDLERAAGERQELTGGSRARNRFRNTRPSDRAQFEDREQVRSALEEQMEMSAEAERARAELEAIAEAVREAGASDPQLQQDLAELMSLLEEAASAEMTEQLRQLSEGLESTGERESRDALEELASQQARFREQLEKSLEQLRRAATEQDLRATTEDARELAQREQALAEALREGTENALRARQQETLLEDARVLEQRMGQLEQRLEMLEETGAQKGVQGAQEEASRSQEAMERAQQELQDGQDAEAAADQAEQAHAAMARAAEELEAAQQDMSTQRSRELQEAIARAGEEALTLARRQTTIRRRMRGSGPDGMKEQLSVQAALLQGFRNMAANLEERTGGMSMEAADVWARIREAFEALSQTLEAMEGETRPTSTAQRTAEGAVKALNGVALAALATEQKGREGSSAADQVMAQLQRLAQQQARINNQATQITQMQLGQEALARQLERLSEGQGDVAGELEELAQQPNAEGQVLGDLEALVEEAKQLAAQLGGGRLDAETRERQERLFHRLLDAGRMLENEEFARDRESTSPNAFERGAVLPVGIDALGVLRYALPSAEQLQQLSTAERELVLRYFDLLNGASGGER